MDKRTEVKELIHWLTTKGGLTYNDIAYLTGVKRITVANVWSKPPHYISDERLERLRYIKSTLQRAIEEGDYSAALLPRPLSKDTVLERARILDSLIR